MKLIGLSGTNGAGKDSVGELLAAEHGFLFISVTDMLRDECRARNLPVERENLRMISSEWRRQGGLGVLIDKAVEQFEMIKEQYHGLVVASLRNPGEADRVHELGGSVLWVDADVQVRYERIKNANRGRGAEDTKTFDQFVAEQEAEMYGVPGDPTSLKMEAVKEKSDIFIDNGGDDLDAFKQHVVFTLTEAEII
jgi:cytidylate kinase